ncbi:ubiquitin carboxyl-terminal hydrolase 2-like isoform X2 [Haliotis cracherodii]|uniref:ubiquitin carboxyl-terminal hydrolase 2-like isoform X2 n=1 Tax=Haliotis cracherodii TaxID=6455 RepID=UPI0039EB12FD
MRSSVLVDRMPSVSNKGYVSMYSSSYRPPSSSSSSSAYTRTPSTTRKYSTPSFNLDSSSSSASAYRRRLPAGPGPLDSSGRKLSEYSVRNRTPSSTRNGPLKADYSPSSTRDNDYMYGTLSNRRTGYSNHEFGTSSRLSGRRSASLANLNDIENLHIGETSKYNARNERDYSSSTCGTTPRRSTYYRDEDILAGSSRTSSRASRISVSVDRENLNSTGYVPRTLSRNVSRDTSPVRERAATPTRRYSTDARESPSITKSVSRQGSNSSLSGALSKNTNGGKVGLRNLGNTCFMNTVIQCLSNTRPLLEYCLKDDYLMDINTTTSSMKGAIMKAYVNIMQSMWKDRSDTYISPNAFKTQVQKFAPRFMGYAQQDSQEFLRYLLEGLHEDVNKVTEKPKPIVLEDNKLERKSDNEKSHEYWRAYLNFDNSKIVDIFVGQLKSELKFSQCGHRSVTFDPFWDLSLPIPKNRSEVSLDDCIRLFMKEEELQDEPMCAKCKERRPCTKSFSIQKFPKILVFHLKRFSQEKFGRKLTTSVEYPTTRLELKDYAAERGGSNMVYNLYAVSNHSGGVHSGHYTAICRHPYSGEWQLYNDTRVSPARSNQAVSSEGYLLFYEQADH